MYPFGLKWKPWMKDFRFGTLVLIPSKEIQETVDLLRRKYDTASSKTSMAHITLTQPLNGPLAINDLSKIEKIIRSFKKFDTALGPAISSPNKKLIWLDVSSKEPLLALRQTLHATSLFRTDLPLTKDFIPHMTISELAREPEDVRGINIELNTKYKIWQTTFSSVSWIIPDEEFVFKEHRSFCLK